MLTLFFDTQAVSYNMRAPPTTSPIPTIIPSPAPTFIVGGPVAIVELEAMLEYRFFPDVTPRSPTQEEADGVISETDRFYTDLLVKAYSNLVSFDAIFVDSVFDLSANLPVAIEFDVYASFISECV